MHGNINDMNLASLLTTTTTTTTAMRGRGGGRLSR